MRRKVLGMALVGLASLGLSVAGFQLGTAQAICGYQCETTTYIYDPNYGITLTENLGFSFLIQAWRSIEGSSYSGACSGSSSTLMRYEYGGTPICGSHPTEYREASPITANDGTISINTCDSCT